MENEMKEIAVRQSGELVETSTQMVARVADRVQAIQNIYRKIMVNGSDFGAVPNCGDKPVLLKPGAEKLLMAFRVAPSIKIDQRDFDGGHREIMTTTTLTGPDGSVLGEGV